MIAAGDKDCFAIEADISEAYSDSFIALGYFTICIEGASFGLRELDATALGPAYRDARRRLANKGEHIFPYSCEPDGKRLVSLIESALNDDKDSGLTYYGVNADTFTDTIGKSRLAWHLCCSQAFDDGSSVWHFDCGEHVRLIAERDGIFRDKVLSSKLFYGVVNEWIEKFEQALNLSKHG
jgi:hypothetical protein